MWTIWHPAIAASLEDARAENTLLDACGPNTLSTNAVLDLLMSALGRRRANCSFARQRDERRRRRFRKPA